MALLQALRKVRRLHYSGRNAILPYKWSRWALAASIALAYAENTQSLCSDLTTYLITFYLLALVDNYFIPRGTDSEIEVAFDEEDEEAYSLDESLGSTFSPADLDCQLQHSSDKPLLREMSEVQIWERSTLAFGLGLVCTYFKMLEIDVCWQLLLFYCAALALYTILKIIKTMRKYEYGLKDFQKQPLN